MGDEKALKELSKQVQALVDGQKLLASEASLTKKLKEFKEELSKNITDKFNSCNRKTERVDNRVTSLEAKVDNHVDNQRRCCNLIINGIPYDGDEIVGDIFATLSSKLGFDAAPDVDCYRFKGDDDDKRPILVKFTSEVYKQRFFQRYLKNPKIITLDIFPGFSGNKSRVFIQHDLSSSQYKVNKAAIKNRKAGCELTIRIDHGNALVKIGNDKTFSFYPSAEALEEDIKKRKVKK